MTIAHLLPWLWLVLLLVFAIEVVLHAMRKR